MWQRSKFIAEGVTRGGPRPWKNREVTVINHASMRPAMDADIDFSTLNLKYPLIISTENLTKSGWAKPPLAPPALPFFVERSTVGAAIPVYTEFKGGGTKVLTILRKIGGDINALKEEMEKVCETEVMVRPGKLVVAGNYSLRMKKWLIGIGF